MTSDVDTVSSELLDFLRARTKRPFTETDDLFAAGGLTSLFAMELVTFVEQRFGVVVDGPDLTLDNFRTVRAMTDLVHRLRGAP
ncbi:acyl carrier protein [Virgisporangium aurantiacum]|uniref:Carrier domain-containing protein n=1 Tax=Virgisporangium aurantiacum TaxID=175570 RepID=A0A8J3ZF07_9ACTN|nr:acyl carrier protein [Virgisporangium aurantiacum]GIJ60113.1 hypothetical protein Vau01_076290 [Virgisporangium aurantiacum]